MRNTQTTIDRQSAVNSWDRPYRVWPIWKYHIFSICPFRSLLENVQDLWFWVKIEKVMKENMGMTQNKTSQNIRKEDERSAIRFPMAPYGCHMEVLWLLTRSLWPPLVLYGPPTDPLWLPLSQIGPSLVFKWTLMDPSAPLWPLLVAYGPFWAPYCAKVSHRECRWPIWQ